MKNVIRYVISGTGLAGLCSCTVGPINYLQFFYALLSSNSATIHVERGKKKRQLEFGGSVTAGAQEERSEFSVGQSIDLKTGTYDDHPTNCFMRFPQYSANVYAAVLGEKLVSGLMEATYSEITGQRFYSFAGGAGVRLYRKTVAGRAFFLVGTTNLAGEVDIISDEFGTMYHLSDSFGARRYFVGFSLGGNTVNRRFIMNPFLNLNGRYFNLFKPVFYSLQAINGETERICPYFQSRTRNV
ncbi:MAG: hypothetical protein JW863_12470, partial [Chitinispirillaceae bacterium]|nr:hypothetical protein [Chitinispirillaceae bacterium]